MTLTYDFRTEDCIVNFLPEPEWAAALLSASAHNWTHADAGLVGVSHQSGYLVLTYKGHSERHRGASVSNCGHDDEFVVHLAAKFKAKVDDN